MEVIIIQDLVTKKARQVIKGEPLSLKENETIVGSVYPSASTKLAVLATKHGLPLPEFLDVARWLLNKECPYCKLSTEILRLTSKLGDERTQAFIDRLRTAKQNRDETALRQIAEEVNELIQL